MRVEEGRVEEGGSLCQTALKSRFPKFVQNFGFCNFDALNLRSFVFKLL